MYCENAFQISKCHKTNRTKRTHEELILVYGPRQSDECSLRLRLALKNYEGKGKKREN